MKYTEMLRKKKKIILGLVINMSLFLSCQEKKQKTIENSKIVLEKHNNHDIEIKTYQYSQTALSKLQEEAEEGNGESFQELADYYFGDGQERKNEFYPICKIMADKYNDANAAYYIFILLKKKYKDICKNREVINCMTKEDKAIALRYLIKAKDNNQEGALFEYEELRKVGIIR